MASIISSLPIYTITSMIGREVITQVIKETANNAYGAMYNFIDHPEINRTLKELDTKVTLQKTEKYNKKYKYKRY